MRSTNISQVDAHFVGDNHLIEFLLYYRDRINGSRLRRALRSLTVDFWPLFGAYRDGLIRQQVYAEHRVFDQFRVQTDIDGLTDPAEIHRRFRGLDREPGDGLFSLALVHLDRGMVLLPRMNHLVGDSYSYFYFLSVLAALTRGRPLPLRGALIRRMARPGHDRTRLRPFRYPAGNSAPAGACAESQVRIETISRAQIRSRLAALETTGHVGLALNDLLAALAWRGCARLGLVPDAEPYSMTLPIDARRQVKALGPRFFGNGLQFHRLEMPAGDLRDGDPAVLATAIRASIPTLTAASYGEYLDALGAAIEADPAHRPKPYEPASGCLVTNLSRPPVGRLDFGSGPPSLVQPLTVGRNSAAVLADADNYYLRLAD